MASVETNIVFFSLDRDAPLAADELSERLETASGVSIGSELLLWFILYRLASYSNDTGGYGNGDKMRAVANLHISSEDVEYTLHAVRSALASG